MKTNSSPKNDDTDKHQVSVACNLERLSIADAAVATNHEFFNNPEPIFDRSEFFDIAYHGYEGDVNFYSGRATSGDVLYLGSGTGRIFNKIWQLNRDVIGVDKSKSMISSLMRKNPCLKNGQIIEGDVLDLEFPGGSYDTIIAPYSFLPFFDPTNIEKLLRKIHSWLKPQGSFFTDIFSPFTNPPFNQTTELERSGTKGDLSYKIYNHYDHFSQHLTEITCIHNGSSHHDFEMNMYFYYPNELRRLIEESNLRVVDMWGDFLKKTAPSITSKVFVFHIKKP